jgi:hypothetical protein
MQIAANSFRICVIPESRDSIGKFTLFRYDSTQYFFANRGKSRRVAWGSGAGRWSCETEPPAMHSHPGPIDSKHRRETPCGGPAG